MLTFEQTPLRARRRYYRQLRKKVVSGKWCAVEGFVKCALLAKGGSGRERRGGEFGRYGQKTEKSALLLKLVFSQTHFGLLDFCSQGNSRGGQS